GGSRARRARRINKIRVADRCNITRHRRHPSEGRRARTRGRQLDRHYAGRETMNEPRVPLRREQDAPRRKLRKGLFLLPSLFTAGNIAAGYYAIVQAMQGTPGEYWHFDHAAIAIGFAILLDGLDGRLARR